jgi:hypothetical protein
MRRGSNCVVTCRHKLVEPAFGLFGSMGSFCDVSIGPQKDVLDDFYANFEQTLFLVVSSSICDEGFFFLRWFFHHD